MRIAQEEIFGPVVSVIPFEGFEEAVAIANGVPYGLSASIYTRNVNQAFPAMRDLFTGIVYVKRADHWCGDAPAIRRDKTDRQRTSRGCHRGD